MCILAFAGSVLLIGYRQMALPCFAAQRTYTVGPDSKPCDPAFAKYSTYNRYTKHYYLLRSYMEKFEKAGGGTLILKKGTYNLSVTVYIPSNVTLKLSDGVVLNKITKTGTSKIKPSKSMFMLCAPSVSKKANKFTAGNYADGYTEYNGVHDVKILGSGSVTLKLHSLKGGIGIDMAHNQNVEISGIRFRQLGIGHFIEMDAGRNITVSGCSFSAETNGGTNIKEAINLDTPDLTTAGFTAPWSSFDKTANTEIMIRDCTFTHLCRAIGTHKYSYGHPHTAVTVTGCTFTDLSNAAITPMYWQDSYITNNTFDETAAGTGRRSIFAAGAARLTISGNTFSGMDRAEQFYCWSDSGYPVIYPEVNAAQVTDNTYINVYEPFLRVNESWDETAGLPLWSRSTKIPISVQ